MRSRALRSSPTPFRPDVTRPGSHGAEPGRIPSADDTVTAVQALEYVRERVVTPSLVTRRTPGRVATDRLGWEERPGVPWGGDVEVVCVADDVRTFI